MVALSARTVLLVSWILCIVLAGCHGSDQETRPEGQPSPTEVLQQQTTALRAQNDSLRRQLSAAEQSGRTSTARLADLEMQLADCNSKLAALTAPPTVKPLPSANAMQTYADALREFRSRNYSGASVLFGQALDNGIEENLKDNCVYWMGECAYGAHQYKEAVDHFQKVFTFRISEKKDDSQIMIANCYLRMGNKAKAREALDRLLKVFPASPFVKLAKEKLQKLG